MADQQEELEATVLQLPETERARLKDRTERIWAEEADRRYQEIQRGAVAVQESEAVFKEARARLR